MAKKPKKPFDNIIEARGWLEMTERYPDLLTSADLPEQMAKVRQAMRDLMEFRNIVAAMAKMDESPVEAAKFYTA